ncbi:MAG: class I SAM-dependent RNA methyltransferase [Anaerolineae bacterium]|nr:class I SAM-dependent RNA methyltransferase [Anaerolineae bacterium]
MTDDTFELDLIEMVHGGQQLGRHDGRVIFTRYAIPGERISARIVDDRERFAFAEAASILTPSPQRVVPPCPHFGPGKCGGCHFQHIDYAAQPEFKRDVVIDQFTRIGGFDNPPILPTIPSPDPWAYRTHATLTVTPDGAIGFIGTDDQTVIPLEECHILRVELLELLDMLDLDGVPELERVRVQVGSDPDDRMITLSTRGDEAPELEVDLPVSINFLLSDNEPVNLIGSSYVTYNVRGREFRVTAGGFFQVNLPQAATLIDLVLGRLDLQGDETVLDLYAGVGLFTAFIAERASLVVSVESYPPAATDADVNLSDLDNIELVEGNVEDVLPALEGPFDAAVLDPPRSGISTHAIDALAALAPRQIVYVSCEPSTLARDAKRLARKGYRLVDVQPVDMFPQTFHVECVAHFVR